MWGRTLAEQYHRSEGNFQSKFRHDYLFLCGCLGLRLLPPQCIQRVKKVFVIPVGVRNMPWGYQRSHSRHFEFHILAIYTSLKVENTTSETKLAFFFFFLFSSLSLYVFYMLHINASKKFQLIGTNIYAPY